MIDPVTAAGLASAIISFLNLTYQVGKRTYEFSALLGELPPNLQSCKDLIDVLARSSERLKSHVSPMINSAIVLGPPTEYESDLRMLFDKCARTTKSFLDLLDDLQKSSSFVKALKLTTRGDKLKEIRNGLEQYSVAILQVLGERWMDGPKEFEIIATNLQEELLRYHEKLESQMTDGFRELGSAVRGSQAELMNGFNQLLSGKTVISERAQQQLLSGQEDLIQSLDRMSENVISALDNNGSIVASRMEALLSDHQVATLALANVPRRGLDDAMTLQLQQLCKELTRVTDVVRMSHAETIRAGSEKKVYHHEVEFEFNFRSEVISIHIRRATKWASSSIFSSGLTWSLPRNVFIPTISIGPSRKCRHGKNKNRVARAEALNIVIKHRKDQYHLIKIDLSDERYNHNVAKAIEMEYTRYRGRFWRRFSVISLSSIQYVKYGAYSSTQRSYRTLQPVERAEHPWRNSPVFPPAGSNFLLHLIQNPDHESNFKALSQRLVFDERNAGMESAQGYALFLQEKPSFGRSALLLILAATSWFIIIAYGGFDFQSSMGLLIVVPFMGLLGQVSYTTGHMLFYWVVLLMVVPLMAYAYILLWRKVAPDGLFLGCVKTSIFILPLMLLLYSLAPEWVEEHAGLYFDWKAIPLEISLSRRSAKHDSPIAEVQGRQSEDPSFNPHGKTE